MKLCQAELSVDIRTRFLPERMVSHWNGFPGKWSQHQICHNSQNAALSHGVHFGRSCEEQGVGVADPSGFLPA